MARFDIYVKFKLQTSVKLEQDETRIGRDSSCQIQIPDGRISRMHAVVQVEGDNHEIENLGLNGTKVNGHEINSPRLLRPGDVIQISDYILAYKSDEMAPDSVIETVVV